MSRVRCHVSGVTCQVLHVIFFLYLFFFLQSGGASWWRVCYQRGLPRLVSAQKGVAQPCSRLPFGVGYYVYPGPTGDANVASPAVF